jgi:hypothetical protein
LLPTINERHKNCIQSCLLLVVTTSQRTLSLSHFSVSSKENRVAADNQRTSRKLHPILLAVTMSQRTLSLSHFSISLKENRFAANNQQTSQKLHPILIIFAFLFVRTTQ